MSTEKEINKIADQDEVLTFLSTIMRDEKKPITARIRAADMLCKTHDLYSEGLKVVNPAPVINLTQEEKKELVAQAVQKVAPLFAKNQKSEEEILEMEKKWGIQT